jgi:hypothetical protein
MQQVTLKEIEYQIKQNFIVCSILLNDGSRIKQKYIGYNLCEAKRKFLELLKSM